MSLNLAYISDIKNHTMDSDVEETEYEPEDFHIGGHDLSITTIAFLPIEQLMQNRSENKEISGQKLWCGSLCVIQYLLNDPQAILGTRAPDCNTSPVVLELGAGTGVLGMICSKLGASRVILTDHDIISINHMTNDCVTNAMDISVSVKTLDWYNPQISEIGLFDEKPKTVPSLPGSTNSKFTIVAGDVLYKKELLVPFFHHSEAALRAV